MSIYDFSSYKGYLKEALKSRDEVRKGSRSAMAKMIGCQSAYVSHVLNGSNDFSLEQGEAINRFFGHSEKEAHFFLLLLQKGRAGTSGLKAYFERQIDSILEERRSIQTRLEMQHELKREEQIIYYSDWVPGAVHMLLMIDSYQTPEKIAARLGLPIDRVQRTLEFLTSSGLVKSIDRRFQVNLQWAYLPKTSPLIRQHHANWRMRALQSFDQHDPFSLYHSGAIAVSNEDASRLREILLQALESSRDIVKNSREEDVFGLNIDFYRI